MVSQAEVTQRAAVEAMVGYAEAREQASAAETAKDYFSQVLKPWLEKNGSLYDGETKWEAQLKSHSQGRWLDEKAPAHLIHWLFEQGVLKVTRRC